MDHDHSCDCAECRTEGVVHAESCECPECKPGPASHADGCGCPECEPRPVVHAESCGCPDCQSEPAAHAGGCDCPECEPKPAAHAASCGCDECQTSPSAAPSFSFGRKAQGDGIVLSLEGRLDASAAAERGDDLIAAIDESAIIILDMTNLTYIASAGLRILLMMQKTAASSEKKLRLENLQPMVRDVLEMSGMDRLFEIA